MSMITTDMTINFTKDLKILYAEDDVELQIQTAEFFRLLFKSVSVVNNGEDALNLYKEEEFDIVISDIRMPKLDGIELTKKIREINPFQNIIIISAYNDNDSLINFINLNIRQFLQKPIDIDNMLETLYYTAKNIVNEKMVEEYRKSLEFSNKALTQKNEELQSLVRILDSKLLQISKEDKEKIQEIDLSTANIQEQYLNELKELEIDISGAAVLISLSNNLQISNIQLLGNMFLAYASILSQYPAYNELNKEIERLGALLNNAPQNFIDKVNDIATLLESFIYVLRMWRTKIVEKKFTKAFEFHSSMINDVSTIITIIDGSEDSIETEIEFF